jgi:hypothetical protein
MGSLKAATVQKTVRIPSDLVAWIEDRAVRLHGGDFTASIIEVLSRSREQIAEDEALLKAVRDHGRALATQQGFEPDHQPSSEDDDSHIPRADKRAGA